LGKEVWSHLRARVSLLVDVEFYFAAHKKQLAKMEIHSVPQLTAYVYNKFMEENK